MGDKDILRRDMESKAKRGRKSKKYAPNPRWDIETSPAFLRRKENAIVEKYKIAQAERYVGCTRKLIKIDDRTYQEIYINDETGKRVR